MSIVLFHRDSIPTLHIREWEQHPRHRNNNYMTIRIMCRYSVPVLNSVGSEFLFLGTARFSATLHRLSSSSNPRRPAPCDGGTTEGDDDGTGILLGDDMGRESRDCRS
jgi:hypothetical protein